MSVGYDNWDKKTGSSLVGAIQFSLLLRLQCVSCFRNLHKNRGIFHTRHLVYNLTIVLSDTYFISFLLLLFLFEDKTHTRNYYDILSE